MAIEIHSERLKLIPFNERNITTQYISWLNNRTLMKYSRHRDTKHTVKSCLTYASMFNHKNNWLFAINTIDNHHIGNINAFLNDDKNSADMGILIGEKQGNGYGKESWTCMQYFLFREIGVQKVTAGCHIRNKIMIKIMVNSNMTPVKHQAQSEQHLVHYEKAISEMEPENNIILRPHREQNHSDIN